MSEAGGEARQSVRELIDGMLGEASEAALWQGIERPGVAPAGHWARTAGPDDPRWQMLRKSRAASPLGLRVRL